ncbi:MAG: sulfotransferase [Alphaproteobacteria bacterium]|jgi:hypothetical protein|nr:sulfotransferase [Alphaproteobacteria bacterium]
MTRPSTILLPTGFGQTLAGVLGRGVMAEPVVICATGGSGTRAMRVILERAGVFMGAGDAVNNVGDAMPFEPYLDEFINAVMEETRSLDYRLDSLPAGLRDRAVDGFRACARRWLEGRPRPAARWGWKNPRAMYMLPVIHAVFPKVRVIHMVRDGRDMAVSTNQWQFIKHYEAVLDRERAGDDDPIESCRLWSKANLDAARWAERALPGRYLRVRLEDLVQRPHDIGREVLAFMDLDQGLLDHAIAEIAEPPSLFRWRRIIPADALEVLQEENHGTLEAFGYLADGMSDRAPARIPSQL